VVDTVRAGTYKAEDLKPWIMMGKGGSGVQFVWNPEFNVSPAIKKMVDDRIQDIVTGKFVVPNDESTPKSE